MKTGLLIVAHDPLASALQFCVLHVIPEAHTYLQAIDVKKNEDCAVVNQRIKDTVAAMKTSSVLVFTDVLGASPCNAARLSISGVTLHFLTGVNLPMLLRAANYDQDGVGLDELTHIALEGGVQGITQLN